MSRVNRPDTLITELRDIKRRLRLLEAGRMGPPSLASPAGPTATPPSGPTLSGPTPSGPATVPADWELTIARPTLGGRGGLVELQLATDPGTTGVARVLVDGHAVGEALPVTETPSAHTIAVRAGSVVAVQAWLSGGTGRIRVTALMHHTN